MKWYQTYKAKYALVGIIFGCCFPIIAIAIDSYRFGLNWTVENIGQIQLQNPIHFIINTAPLFLGFFAWIAGIRQDEIELLNHNLENKIEQQIQSLKEAAKELEQNLRFKELFLANMSHEIRTPMNGILGLLNIIRDDKTLSQTQQEHLDTIHQSSVGLMTILNDVLDLSKLEVGKMELKPSVVNIHEIIQRVLNIFGAVAKQKDIYINYIFNENNPIWLRIDENRLAQVLSNLVGNAIKFTEKGGVTVELEVVNCIDNDCFRISVMDTGVGLTEAEQNIIFNEFQQLDYHKAVGTGLGLSISKKMATLLGGDLGVLSKKGKGATFWFTFKGSIEHTAPEGLEDVSFEDLSPLNLHVLLVEDNKINQRVAQLTLEKMGCTVVLAENGLEALELYQDNTFQLILMDIQMPEMDGVTATKELRKKHQNLPPIIGLSANAMQGDSQRYISEGLDDYLSKPIIIKDLDRMLRKWTRN